jgi:hypothetical protein
MPWSIPSENAAMKKGTPDMSKNGGSGTTYHCTDTPEFRVITATACLFISCCLQEWLVGKISEE